MSLDGEFQIRLRTKAARRKAATQARKKPAPQVILGEPHLLLYTGDDLEHAVWRRRMQRGIWGPG